MVPYFVFLIKSQPDSTLLNKLVSSLLKFHLILLSMRCDFPWQVQTSAKPYITRLIETIWFVRVPCVWYFWYFTDSVFHVDIHIIYTYICIYMIYIYIFVFLCRDFVWFLLSTSPVLLNADHKTERNGCSAKTYFLVWPGTLSLSAPTVQSKTYLHIFRYYYYYI